MIILLGFLGMPLCFKNQYNVDDKYVERIELKIYKGNDMKKEKASYKNSTEVIMKIFNTIDLLLKVGNLGDG
ncbi:hypothetical protein ETU08_00050 [Apibacter muscae]|uniref:hypothetical protein n=1 Tax=Apibacter muscae TaxID=2509004 RepID=UPI0011ACB79E|nr:hypothetical protein [Apibacter muscae]TWP31885.1 hypothetical protein ETU08_00050 [Apibacter muscae]